jgi:cytochrome c oxidase subunit 1
MFTDGLGAVANAIFAVATMAIAVPTGVKIFNWLLTMWGGQIRFTTPMLWSVAFIPSFVLGGVTGIMNAAAPADYQFHDSYFVVAHFHYVIVGGVVFGLFAGAHYWWPKMFGKILNETLGKITFFLFFIGFHLTFFIQHFLGLMGMPRRYFTYLPGQGLETGNLISSIGAGFMGVATIILLINVIYTAVKGEKVGNDPWGVGRTLEWSISSPPPEYNFAQTPYVRGLDAFWIEKIEGDGKMTPAEPLGDIHMPNSSILPFVMSLGLFIAAFGAMYNDTLKNKTAVAVLVLGLVITFGSMFLRSWIDDHGYHIHKEDLTDEGVKA